MSVPQKNANHEGMDCQKLIKLPKLSSNLSSTEDDWNQPGSLRHRKPSHLTSGVELIAECAQIPTAMFQNLVQIQQQWGATNVLIRILNGWGMSTHGCDGQETYAWLNLVPKV